MLRRLSNSALQVIPSESEQFAVSENENGDSTAATSKAPVMRKHYVRRDSERKLTKHVELIPGAPLYEQKAGTRFIQCGRVKGAVESP